MNRIAGVLRPGVGVVQQLAGLDRDALPVPVPQRDPQRGQDQVGDLGARGLPAHDPLGVDVDDERHVDEPGPGPAVGEVRDPTLVGCWRGEVAVQQVPGPVPVLGRDRGPDSSAAADPVHAQITHQAICGAERDLVALPAKPVGHLPATVEPFGGALDVEQRVAEHRVGHRSGSDGAVGLPPGPVGPRGDPAAVLGEHPAGRLDRVTFCSHVVDERHDQRLRGSSSPAKKTVADLRISLSSRSFFTSALSRLISAWASLVTPGPGAGVDVGLDQPAPGGLTTHTDLLRHGRGQGGIGWIVLPMIGEHPQRAFLERGIDLLGHVHILLDSNRSGIKPVTLHLRDTPIAAAMWAWGQPAWRRWTISRRPWTVRRALPWDMRTSGLEWALDKPHPIRRFSLFNEARRYQRPGRVQLICRPSCQGQGEAPVPVVGAGASCFVVVWRWLSVSLATHGQADMRGLVTAGRAVRLERVACLGSSVAGRLARRCS